MKYRNLLAGAALLAFSSLPLAARADVATGYANTTTELLAGPNEHFPAIAHVDSGAPVHIMGCVDGFTWCDISWNGNRGWIDAHYLDSDYNNKHVTVIEHGREEHLPVVTFEQKSYWDSYYHDRPFYTEERYWHTTTP
jgi:uncharacterized protein YraI